MRGLACGKFYPFTNGHKLLIETALAECSEVYVMLIDQEVDSVGWRFPIPAEKRADWIRKTFPSVIVDVFPTIGNDDNSEYWAAYTRACYGWVPDVVYSSEKYGDSWAAALGCEHRLVDLERLQQPISATAFRANPFKNLHMLPPASRQYFVPRVCAVGAESTGKTTLINELATSFNETWVPEFGRLRDEQSQRQTGKLLDWPSDDFLYTAVMQNTYEDIYSSYPYTEVLFCDTNAYITYLWHWRYLNWFREDLLKHERQYDLVLLCDYLPWVNDGTRSAHMLKERITMQQILTIHYPQATILRGDQHKRLAQAKTAVDKLLGKE